MSLIKNIDKAIDEIYYERNKRKKCAINESEEVKEKEYGRR